jgi:DNA uptake protein ComE-like DNA-binding protein
MTVKRFIFAAIVAILLVGFSQSAVLFADDQVDINSASAEQLKKLPGINEGVALMIMGARPFSNPDELVAKKILTQEDYEKIKKSVTAREVKKPAVR